MQDSSGDSFYNDLDRLFDSFVRFLNTFIQSRTLQEFVMDKFSAFCYGNLIKNFFLNLTSENMAELKIPAAQVELARVAFDKTIEEADRAIGLDFKGVMDKSYYDIFATRIRTEFPLLAGVLRAVEDSIDLSRLEDYIKHKKTVAESCGKHAPSFNDIMITQAVGNHLKKTNSFPKEDSLSKAINDELMNIFKSRTEETLRQVKEAMNPVMESHRRELKGFEERLYERWKNALDLLEFVIILSSELGEETKTRLTKNQGSGEIYLNSAAIRIHVRALRMAGEILTLLKSGYADGANARWRSLHEISVISRFLHASGNEVAKRYLEHDVFKRLKDAINYQTHYQELGQPPPEEGTIDRLKEACEELVAKYGESYRYRKGFEWVPETMLKSRDLRSLEENVKLDKMRPYYDMSSNSVHGGAKGFFSLGLMGNEDILLIGPSNAGLADPLYNTAYSLMNITLDLVSIKKDLDVLIPFQATMRILEEIREEAQKAHDQLEGDEKQREIERSKRSV